jgi:hypothetical protein
MPVGDQVLFEHSDEIIAYWQTDVRIANYQVAAFVREMLGSVAILRRVKRRETLNNRESRIQLGLAHDAAVGPSRQQRGE